MGFTYAVQVPVGKEVEIMYRLTKVLERYNPGIIAVHALEQMTQIFKGQDRAPKNLKAKVPGYIFVTTERTENFNSRQGGNLEAGLGMEPSCWQLIKSIPMVRKILNQYIKHDELKQFFDTIDREAEIEISDKNKRPLVSLAEIAIKYLKDKKSKTAQKFLTMLRKVTCKTRGTREVYTIPFSLFYLTRDRIDTGRVESTKKLTTADYILPELAKTIKGVLAWAKR
jgi:transcription antitermination factor NusG